LVSAGTVGEPLPPAVKEEAVDAQYKNGILTVKLPKTEEAKSKRITVKT
jgi:HSP20 family protein